MPELTYRVTVVFSSRAPPSAGSRADHFTLGLLRAVLLPDQNFGFGDALLHQEILGGLLIDTHQILHGLVFRFLAQAHVHIEDRVLADHFSGLGFLGHDLVLVVLVAVPLIPEDDAEVLIGGQGVVILAQKGGDLNGLVLLAHAVAENGNENQRQGPAPPRRNRK